MAPVEMFVDKDVFFFFFNVSALFFPSECSVVDAAIIFILFGIFIILT